MLDKEAGVDHSGVEVGGRRGLTRQSVKHEPPQEAVLLGQVKEVRWRLGPHQKAQEGRHGPHGEQPRDQVPRRGVGAGGGGRQVLVEAVFELSRPKLEGRSTRKHRGERRVLGEGNQHSEREDKFPAFGVPRREEERCEHGDRTRGDHPIPTLWASCHLGEEGRHRHCQHLVIGLERVKGALQQLTLPRGGRSRV